MEQDSLHDTATKLAEIYKERRNKPLENVFTTLGSFPRETSPKKQLALVDLLLRYVQDLLLKPLCDETEEPRESGSDGEDFIPMLIKLTCNVYIRCLSSLRLFQRIQKVLRIFHEFDAGLLMTFLANEVEQLIVSSGSMPDVSYIQHVSIIIQNCCLGRKCIEQNLSKVLLSIVQFCEELLSASKKLLSKEDHYIVGIKSILQLFQCFPVNVADLVFGDNGMMDDDLQSYKRLTVFLITTLYSKELSKECILLCGKAVIMLLSIHPSHLKATTIITQLLTHAGLGKFNQVVSRCVIGKINVDLPAPEHQYLTQIALLQGCLTSSKDAIVISNLNHSANEMNGKDEPCLVWKLFDITYQLCIEANIPVMKYLSFEVLKDWFSCIKRSVQALFKDSTRPMFSQKSDITNKVLTLVWDNLEDPVEGVPNSARALFKSLLEVNRLECQLLHKESCQMHNYLVCRIVSGIPWHVKIRYGLLCDILPYIGLQKLLDQYPNLLDEIAQCLTTNQLSAASTEVLKALLLYHRTHTLPLDKKDDWDRKWRGVLLRTLTSDQRLLQNNARMYWLPCALKSCPDSLQAILDDLSTGYPDVSKNKRELLAYLAVLKSARTLGIAETKFIDESLLREALSHGEDEIRAEALGVISCSHKTAEPFSSLEARLLRGFLVHNFNIANPAFRQDLFVAMKKILIRIRDSSLISLRKRYPKIFNKHQADNKDDTEHAQIEITADISQALEQVGWLNDLLMDSLLPGASYQRQKTALELFFIMLQTFISEWNPDKKKGQPPEACKTLVVLAARKGFYDLTSSRNTAVLIGCLKSTHTDVRESAVTILKQHFPAPLKSIADDTDSKERAVRLLQKAAALMFSTKAQECESGSALCQLLFEKYVRDLDHQLSDVFKSCAAHLHDNIGISFMSKSSASSCDVPQTEGRACIEFISELLKEVKTQFSLAKEDLSVAAEQAPVHGVLLALTRCVCTILDGLICGHPVSYHSSVFLAGFGSILHETIQLASGIIDFMLGVLSSKNDSMTVVCGASFAGMKQAVEDVVGPLDGEDSKSPQNNTELAMSCCFLCMKVASNLLSSVAERVAVADPDSPSHQQSMYSRAVISVDDMAGIGDVLMRICTQCRHWGILLSCKANLLQVCRHLISSPVKSLQSLPKAWLDHVIDAIATDKAGSSVTRRSAGLPVLIVTVLGCESPANRLALLHQCGNTLIDLASLPLPEVVDETTDLPQVHAINILRALYQDTCLGVEVLMLAERGVVLAITGFSSTSWAIRNAATQLFGSLVLRMFGHKQGQQGDDSQFNSIATRDFFNRFPSLRQFFLRRIRSLSSGVSCSAHADRSHLNPEVFPILTLLSKLRPASTSEEEDLLKEFVPVLIPLASSPVYAVRSLAARALVPFISVDGLENTITDLLRSLPTIHQKVSQNNVHGTLLQVRKLAAAARESSTLRGAMTIIHELRNHSWLGTNQNACAVTRAEYLSVVMEMAPQIMEAADNEVQFARDLITSSAALTSELQVSPGLPSLQRMLGKFSMDMMCDKFWLTDHLSSVEKAKTTKELLSRESSDTRLAVLEHLQSNTDIDRSTTWNKEITLLTTRETNQKCLLLALDTFTKINEEHCLVDKKDVAPLWRTCISYCGRARGLAVAAKAIPVCSILLCSVLLDEQSNQRISDVESDMVMEWSGQIRQASVPDSPESLRMGTAHGLTIAGKSLVMAGLRSKTERDRKRSDDLLLKACVSLFVSATMLMEDEDEDIRVMASRVGTQLTQCGSSSVARSSPPAVSSVAIVTLFDVMSREFWWCQSLWVAMGTMIRGRHRPTEVIAGYMKSRQMLFEQEDSNLFAEPFYTAQLACTHLKIIIDRLSDSRLSNENDVISSFTNWLIDVVDKLTCDVRAVCESGLAESGSLQYPKPFYIWYRLVLMYDVIQYAVSTLGSPVCPRFNGLQLLLKQTLLEKIQLISATHPSLLESCRSLELA